MKKLIVTLMALVAISATGMAQKRVKFLSTTSEKLNVNELKMVDQSVTINRYLFAGYNTICLPMTLTAEQLQKAAKDVRIERLAGIKQEGTTLNLYFVDCTADGIQAGEPYLIFSPKAQSMNARSTEAINVNSELKAVRMSDAIGNRICFSSSYESITGEARRYGIPAKQDVEVLESVLMPTDPEKTFLPTRCGITWEQQNATASNLVIKHAATDEISDILVDNEKGSAVVYDLAGRRVNNKTHKGIYVVDGKKTAVK